ncbi:MAG: uroporphyrinogen decarboxylase family protein [Armatimonadota bacterium]|nr:hypothetical protein [bacterium]
MTSLQRTLDFISGRMTDVPPFHPIIMQFAADYAGTDYCDFCLKPEKKVHAMIECADHFNLDWVTVMSDPYVEADGFGLQVAYPKNSLPHNVGLLINDISDVKNLKVPEFCESQRMQNRVKEIELFNQQVGEKYFIVGWAEGPLAEYADLRGLTDTCLDLYDHETEVNQAFDIIIENAMNLIRAQVDAGARCIGIGDAACSQISPNFYKHYVHNRERELVDYTHSLGAMVKLHICGNTTAILPDMISTGADIIDVDHLVADMFIFTPLLGDHQVLSGNSDPVEVVMRGTGDTIMASVKKCHMETAGRGIVSAGCEIPLGTSVENFKAYSKAARSLRS